LNTAATTGADSPAGETPVSLPRRLLRSAAFKLSLIYLVIFAVFAFLILGYVAWNARRLIEDQIRSTIEAEITGLAEQHRIGGIRRLITVIEQRSRAPGASIYLVTTPFGERLVGNIDALPPGVLDGPGEYEINYTRSNETDISRHRAITRIYVLPAGFRLLVGRDVEERERMRLVIRRAGGWSLLLVLTLGFFGGWFIASRVLKRVDGMTETARTLMTGDMQGRLAVHGTGDEFDRLAINLNTMLDRISALMQGLSQVSDNIAHDLKTPLTRLRNRAEEALRTAHQPDELRAALDATIDEADGLIRVFNALLMIARLEAGQVREAMGPISVAEIVESVGELYEPVAEESGVDLQVLAAPDLMVQGNRELIGQALANLVDNAIKYGKPVDPAQKPVVTLSAALSSAGVAFCVTDRGAGVPETDRTRVLERFVRLDDSRSRPGFGLGLSLVAGVASLHGGRLMLEDAAPGLKITLLVPATESAVPVSVFNQDMTNGLSA
jgi:signal transduction histidine kinase